MILLRKAGHLLNRLLAAIGLITVLVMSTPMVSWWARAYSGPIVRPKGDVLILLSAAATIRAASPIHPTGVHARRCMHGKPGASRRL